MKSIAWAAAFAAASLFSAVPAFADAAMGGTNMWKMVGADRYLLELDWNYITNPQRAEEQTYVLYDNETGTGTGTLEGTYEDFTTDTGCHFLVEGDDGAGTMVLTVSNKVACGDDAVFIGNYVLYWDHENP